MQQTLVVVGAGASAEFGLPIASGLQRTIRDYTDVRFNNGFHQSGGDQQIFNCAKSRFPGEDQMVQQAAWRIRDGLLTASSIDTFLDNHRNDPKMRWIGVLSIAKAIVQAELNSSLHVDTSNINNRLDFDRLKSNWLTELFKVLSRNRPKHELSDFFSNISFVIFNYDRCVEHFLFWALQAHYAISQQEATIVMQKAKIIHPYGTIGRLPWQSGVGASIGYGDERYPLIEMAERIRTFTDQIEDEEMMKQLGAAVDAANLIYFLGFSYQPQNLKLLSSGNILEPDDVIGTALEISDYDKSQIKRAMQGYMGVKLDATFHLEDKTCVQMLTHYSRAFGN